LGARPGLKCAILETGMSDGTRSKVNKDEIEDLYKTALERYSKPKNTRAISTTGVRITGVCTTDVRTIGVHTSSVHITGVRTIGRTGYSIVCTTITLTF